MARAREWYREAKYWAGRWVVRRLDSALKNHIDKLNRDD